MDYQRYLGYKFDEFEGILKIIDRPFEVIEVLPPSGKKIGDERRIVKIEDMNDVLRIYVSYF